MKKAFIFLVSVLLIAPSVRAQSVDKLFKKYTVDKRFEYISLGRGVMKIASLFADYSDVTDGIMSRIVSLKILKLEKDSTNAALYTSFVGDIAKIVEKGKFETTLEKRGKDDQTYIYKRVDPKANADILIYTKDIKGVIIIWLKGKLSPEEMDKMQKEKEQNQEEEQQDNTETVA